jgi:DNA-binding response OmpR family regulator
MRGKLSLVHWNTTEAEDLAASLQEQRWQVTIESDDGARAVKRILAEPPDAVIIYLTRLPSHGVETARALRSTHTGRSLPILFVDGSKEKVEKAQAKVPDAIYTTSSGLFKVLAKIAIKKAHDTNISKNLF